MNLARTTFAVLLLATIGVHGADAQTAKTREQVKAELAEAIRAGNVPAAGESGLWLSELYPQRYPKPAVEAGSTRDKVRAELAEAIRTGNMIASGDSGLKLNEEFPNRYPVLAVATGKSREQVRTETAEAIRAGDMVAAGEVGLKLNELYPQRYAKERGVYTAQARSPSAAASAAMR